MEHLAVADQALDVRLGEEVGRRRDEQDLGALLVERVAHVDAGVFLDVFLQPLERVAQTPAGQAQVVADLVHLADDLVAVLLPETDRVHDLARRHRHLGGVDAVGAEHAAAPALGTLVVVGVPVVEHLAVRSFAPTSFGKILAGEGEMAAVDRAHQVLARDRHVLRVAGAEEVVALVAARAAVHAGVHVDAQAGTCRAARPSSRWRVAPSRRQLVRESRSAPGSPARRRTACCAPSPRRRRAGSPDRA